MTQKWLIFLAIVVFLPACGEKLFTMDNLMLLERGTRKKEVQRMVDSEPIIEKKFTVSGSDYSLQMYKRKVGIQYRGEYDMNNKYVSKKIDLYDEYYFLFDSKDQIIYWGLLSELASTDNQSIAEIGRYIKANIKGWY